MGRAAGASQRRRITVDSLRAEKRWVHRECPSEKKYEKEEAQAHEGHKPQQGGVNGVQVTDLHEKRGSGSSRAATYVKPRKRIEEGKEKGSEREPGGWTERACGNIVGPRERAAHETRHINDNTSEFE